LTFRLNDSIEDTSVNVFRMPLENRLQGHQHLPDRLQKFGFAGIAALDGV
jgi:hypothetical protein